MKDTSKLTKKRITDKNGNQRSVWVKMGGDDRSDKQKRTDAHSEKQKEDAPNSKTGQKYVSWMKEAKTMEELTAAKNKVFKLEDDNIFGVDDNVEVTKLVTAAYKKRKEELSGDKSESKLSEAEIENVKSKFVRAKNAYNGAKNDKEKKAAAEALQGFHEKLKQAGVQKEGTPFWSKDLIQKVSQKASPTK